MAGRTAQRTLSLAGRPGWNALHKQHGQRSPALGPRSLTVQAPHMLHTLKSNVASSRLKMHRSHVRPLLGTLSDFFQMLSPSSAKQIPVRSSLQLQLSSRMSHIWLPVDSKSTTPYMMTLEATIFGSSERKISLYRAFAIPRGFISRSEPVISMQIIFQQAARTQPILFEAMLDAAQEEIMHQDTAMND